MEEDDESLCGFLIGIFIRCFFVALGEGGSAEFAFWDLLLWVLREKLQLGARTGFGVFAIAAAKGMASSPCLLSPLRQHPIVGT